MTNSKAKGARGERELSQKLRELGWDCRRSQQYCGANNDADVIGLPGVHIEAKRVEKPSWSDDWLLQAKRDCGENIPAVFHRRNNEGWKVTMDIDDWIKLYNEYEVHFKED